MRRAGLLEQDRDAWLRIPYPDRLAIVREGLQKLQQTIARQCPGGEDHHYEQQGDDRPPTCPHCGFTDPGKDVERRHSALGAAA